MMEAVCGPTLYARGPAFEFRSASRAWAVRPRAVRLRPFHTFFTSDTAVRLSRSNSLASNPLSIPRISRFRASLSAWWANGCGKSNIIDAVRWVLGESRASELRGESMQDVIFNGSTARKPGSRASVELIFDNSDGRAAGQ